MNKNANQKEESDDDYENSGDDGFEKEEENDDLKLQQIKKAMKRENANVDKSKPF